jgi:hypothetical protein
MVGEMEAAIRRGAERLRELQRQGPDLPPEVPGEAAPAPAAAAEPTAAWLGVEEITDPVAIRALEGQLAGG